MNTAENPYVTNTVLGNIPIELKRLNQWVAWGVDKAKPKMPFNPKTMNPARAGNPQTWGTYQQAINRVTRGQARGVGFEFNNNGIYGIDLDKVIIDEQLTAEASEVVSLLNSYTEISPSGTGLHILVKAQNIALEANRKDFIEIYTKDRYFTVTGDIYGELKPIEERTEALLNIYGKYLKPKPPDAVKPKEAINTNDYKDDREFLKIGLDKDHTLYDFWNGARPNGNESADDQGFINKLAYWCNGDEVLIQTAFLNSPYFAQKDTSHKKKCGRQDYVLRTIKKALGDLRTTAREANDRFIEQSKFHPARPQNHKYEVKPTSSGYAPADAESPELKTMTAVEIMQGDFGELRYIAKDFIHQGLVILAAPPKFGKSWLAFDMCVCVAFGEPFLGYETIKGDTLYLALEDSNRRLKDRLSKLLNGRKPPDNLHLAIKAGTLDDGLGGQIERHLKKFPNTVLIVVDILQRVRSKKVSGMGKNAYELDTDDLAKLKAIADRHNICIFALHHPRKLKDSSDPFNNFSGSTGIQGAVDEMFILDKETRDDSQAKLLMTSREMDGKELVIRFNKDSCKWELVGTVEEEQQKREFEQYNKDPVVIAVRAMLAENPLGFTTRASEFTTVMIPYTNTTVPENEIGKRFKKYAYFMYKYDRIKYEPPQYSKQKVHKFTHANKYQISFLNNEEDKQ